MPDEYFGVFREETSHNVGDDYDKRKYKHARFGGKQFGTEFPKTGKNSDAYLDKKFKRLTEDHRYVDPLLIERQLQKRSGKPVSDKPFKPSSPAKKPAGPGATDGCIGEIHMLGPDPGRPDSSRNSKLAGKKKIYTSPAPKSGFGYPYQSRTIGGTSPAYMVDTYQYGRTLEKSMKTTAREKIAKPFICNFKQDGIFWQNPYTDPPMPPKQNEKENDKPKVIWRPSHPPRKGKAYANISRVGLDYEPDPVREAQFQANKGGGEKSFKPGQGPRKRMSVWAVNHYSMPKRPPASLDFTLL